MFDFHEVAAMEQKLAKYAECQQGWLKYWQEEGTEEYIRKTEIRIRRTAAARKALRSFLADTENEDLLPDGI